MCLVCNDTYIVHRDLGYGFSFGPCPNCGPKPKEQQEREREQFEEYIQALKSGQEVKA